MILFLEFLLFHFICISFVIRFLLELLFLVFIILSVLVFMHVNFSLKYFNWILQSLIAIVFILLI